MPGLCTTGLAVAWMRGSGRLRDAVWVKLRPSLVLVLVMALTGCTASNEVGVRLLDRNALTVVNCGTYIERVTVRDATAQRVLWSAHAVRDRSAEVPGTDAVAIGVLPERAWIEDTRLDRSSRPKVWRITVWSPDRATIVVPNTALRPGRVFRPGVNHSESLSAFDDECNGVPGWLVGGTLGLIALSALLGAVLLIARSQRRRGVSPPAVPLAGWYEDPGGASTWRYWDGSAWTDHTA